MSRGPLYIFDTHPIQYRAPVFRDLHKNGVDLKVYYFGDRFDGKKWWFSEIGKIPKQVWNLPLFEGYPSSLIPQRGGWLGFFLRILLLLRRDRPAGVLIYGWYLPQHWILWGLCAYLEIPLIFVGETFHVGKSTTRRALKKFLHPLFFSRVHQVISIGDKTHEFYRYLRIPEERITPAKYCIDTSFFDVSEKEKHEIRARVRQSLQIPSDAVVALFVGRLFERKRPTDVVLVHKLCDRHTKLHTVIVGNGPMQNYLMDLAKGDPRIHFAGFRDQRQTREMYAAADFLLVPSEFETWGLVINEAFASGIPAVVTDTCGAANDLVQNGSTGFIYPVGRLQEASQQVHLLLENPSLREEMGVRAKERVNAYYGVSQFSTAIRCAFERAHV